MAVDPLSTGPEAPEAEKAAKDGKPSSNGNGKSVGEQAEEGAQIPEAPPLQGDSQLSLKGLGQRGVPVESRVSIDSASVPVEGLMDPQKDGQLLVAYRPRGYNYVPVRDSADPTKVIRWKVIQSLRPVHIQKISPELEAAIAAVNEEHELIPTPV
jgi:hypothetical protein